MLFGATAPRLAGRIRPSSAWPGGCFAQRTRTGRKRTFGLPRCYRTSRQLILPIATTLHPAYKLFWLCKIDISPMPHGAHGDWSVATLGEQGQSGGNLNWNWSWNSAEILRQRGTSSWTLLPPARVTEYGAQYKLLYLPCCLPYLTLNFSRNFCRIWLSCWPQYLGDSAAAL